MLTITDDGVTLPNGRFVALANIPKDVEEGVLQDKLINGGLATFDEFRKPLPGAAAGEFIKDNPDIVLGTSLSVAGGVMGAPFGPPGVAIGSTTLGAAGDFIGQLMKQGYKGEDLDYMEAVASALTGVGIDIATLKLGKYLEPLRLTAMKKMGFSPQEVAEKIVNQATPTAGSLQSLQESQRILERGIPGRPNSAATLTRVQTGRSNPAERVTENLAEVGIFSGGLMDKNAARVNAVVQNTFQELIGETNFDVSPRSLGDLMSEVIDQGKKSGFAVYEKELSKEVTERLGTKRANTVFIRNTLVNFLNDNKRFFGSNLDESTRKFIEGDLLTSAFGKENGVSVKAIELLDFDKKLTQKINTLYDEKKSVPARELADLQSQIKNAIQETLERVDPIAAQNYGKLKNDYRMFISSLLPDINQTYINKAKKDDFNALGRFLTNIPSDNESAVTKFFTSLETGFDKISKNQNKTEARVKSLDEAKQLIRQGYLKNLIPDISDEGFNIQKYGRLADRFNTPAKNAVLKQVMGDQYQSTKQLFNLMKEATQKPEGNIGELVLRSKEYAALGQAGLGFTAASFDQALLSGAILFTPIMFAYLSTNKKAVNKLLAFEKSKFADTQKRDTAISVIIGDVIDALTQDEQAELRNMFRQTKDENEAA